MENIRNNIIYLSGVLLCIIYIVIPASNGLLGEGISNALGFLNANSFLLIAFFIIPILLFAVAEVSFFFKKVQIAGFILICFGAVLFLIMDVRFAMAHQAYLGCYINAIGAVIALTGAAMETFGTREEQVDEEIELRKPDDSLYFGDELKQTLDETVEPIVFTDSVAQNDTEFNEGIEKLFMDEEQLVELSQEELTDENEEIIGNNDGNNDGGDHVYSNDSFWG